MALCPRDMKPCCDDLCYGGGCILLAGRPAMYERCSGCGEYVSDDDDSDCRCEPDYEDDFFFDPWE